MVKIEKRVETKIIWLAKIASAPYLSARMEAVEPAGIPDITTARLRIFKIIIFSQLNNL